jgi:hypothetical protein
MILTQSLSIDHLVELCKGDEVSDPRRNSTWKYVIVYNWASCKFTLNILAKRIMGIKFITHILGAMVLVLVITGCTQGASGEENDSVVAASMEVIITKVADTPQPTASPMPLPTVMAGQALQIYRTMLIIQANAEQIREVAILLDSGAGEANLKESPMMMSLSVSVVSVDDLIKNVQESNSISLPWQRAYFVHQESKEVLGSWMGGEAKASQVIEAMVPVIDDIRRDVIEVEETLVSEFGYDRSELDQERQAVLEVMRQMLGGRDG